MEETPAFELPKPSEKLPYKFILDSLREQQIEAQVEQTTTVEAAPAELALSGEIVEADSLPADELSVADIPESELLDEELPPQSVPMKELVLEPGKKYFRIGEVSELIGVEAYVLRYWESEFPGVRPVKSGSGHRVYSRKDVEMLHLIRHLLHEEKYSIKGARKKLQQKGPAGDPVGDASRKQTRELLRNLASQLKDLIQIARGNPGTF